jgi:DUF4097 and DUF4098 domain-containing protein YvlB
MSNRHRPSLLGALLWIGLGILFLLRNFGIGPSFWSLAARYWPVLLILLGLGKVIDYYLKKDAFSIRLGEVFGICLLLLIGSSLTMISDSQMARFVRNLPIEIGDSSLQPGQYIGESHAFTEETTIPLPQPSPIRVENSYGSVSVSPGTDGEIRVRLRKVIYAEEARAADIASRIRLEPGSEAATAEKPEAEPGKTPAGGPIVIRTNRESLENAGETANTDMEILAPRSSRLEIRNAFGEVRVTGIEGAMDLSTSHRPLEIRDCAGRFTLSNRYGDTRLTNLNGDVKLEGRGKVYLENIKGNVEVRNEYSPMEISNVEGSVTVSITENSVRVEKVTGPVAIDARGARVKVEGLKGNLKITASHQSVDISDVASAVSVESRYASLTLKDIGGNVEIRSNADNIRAEEIKGSLKVQARASAVRANRVLGPMDIQTSLKDVSVSDAADSCSIINEHADVRVSSQSLGKGSIDVRNRNGAIALVLPAGASFEMNATARNGNIRSDYPDLGPVRKEGNSAVLKARVKTGGPRILLETEYDDIEISGGSAENERKRPRPERPGKTLSASFSAGRD